MSINKGANKKLFEYARQNRKEQTEAEKLLWENLRNRRLGEFKFRRQHPIAGFVADFYCHEAGLVVEVDGNIHTEKEQKEYDKGRTYELKEQGIKVIRFSNEEVLYKINWVLVEIRKHFTE